MVAGSNPAVPTMLRKKEWKFKKLNIRNAKLYFKQLGWIYYYSSLTDSLNLRFWYLACSDYNKLNNLLKNTQYKTLNKTLLVKPQLTRLKSSMDLNKFSALKTISFKELIQDNNQLVYNLYLVYIKFTLLYSVTSYKLHQEYKLFFQISTTNENLIINSTQLYRRWSHSYNFLLNLFFFQKSLLLFGPKYLKPEIHAFNWSMKEDKMQFFKYNIPYYMFTDPAYGLESLVTFKRIRDMKLNAVIILDTLPYKRNLYYLRIMNIFTIGLIPSNVNPWSVNFPIPTFNLSIFIQYYFLKFFLFIKQQATLVQYNNKLTLWKFI